MLHFNWPWLFLAIPLPYLFRIVLPTDHSNQKAALKVHFLEDFLSEKSTLEPKISYPFLFIIIFTWLLLVTATARPQWIGEPIQQATNGRNLMLAIDLSGSMAEQDFIINNKPINRLLATKNVATNFIRQRIGDKIGLILFGTHAYLQTPLTFDRETVIKLLNEAFIGMTDDQPATSIGDAIGLATKKLTRQSNDSRVLILLTDGANTAGEITPLKAADLAASQHLKIYTIGVGADELIIQSFFGAKKVNPSRDLDEKTLKKIAEKTGGHYFRARNMKELNVIYQMLDKLEPIEQEKQYFRPRQELYFYPLSIGLLLIFFLCFTRVFNAR